MGFCHFKHDFLYLKKIKIKLYVICNVADYYANNFGLQHTFYSSETGGEYPNDWKVTCAL